jgi:hypothetical protein
MAKFSGPSRLHARIGESGRERRLALVVAPRQPISGQPERHEDVIFSDARLTPSFSFTTPAKKPRTECGCQPVTFMIAAMVALSWDRSRLRTRSCLVVPLREPEARAAFCLVLKLRRFETLKRERDFAFDRAIGTSERGDTIVATPRPGRQPAGSGPEALACCLGHRQQRSNFAEKSSRT